MKLPLTNTDLKKMYKRKTDNKMRDYGDTDLEKKVIRVNKKKSRKSGKRGEVLDTIVHEARHAKHPKEHEKTTRKKTKKLIKRLNKKQKRSYYNLFS
jgi:hypothetical protein